MKHANATSLVDEPTDPELGMARALLRRSAALTGDEGVVAPAEAGDGSLDDEGELLLAAASLGPQLAGALGLAVSAADRRDVAVEVLVGAGTFATASDAAIGAICALLDAVTAGDGDRAAELVGAALAQLDPIDLFEAAAALAASITEVVAMRLDLATAVVVTELDRSLSARAARAVGERQRGPHARPAHRGSAPRPGRRQTWSGRNSQCHGSRGTASTQPKRGPFAFSQRSVRGSVTSASTASPQPWLERPGVAARPPCE